MMNSFITNLVGSGFMKEAVLELGSSQASKMVAGRNRIRTIC